jgi:hypothetical protein
MLLLAYQGAHLQVLCGMCPPKMVQYFHDQVLAFLLDHHVTAADIVMPRV